MKSQMQSTLTAVAFYCFGLYNRIVDTHVCIERDASRLLNLVKAFLQSQNLLLYAPRQLKSSSKQVGVALS